MLLQTESVVELEFVVEPCVKVISLLLGQQGGYTKYPCFMCLWDSRSDARHFVQKIWPTRDELAIGEHNVIKVQLVERKNVLLPPLRIKFGLMKNFVKALPKDSAGFLYLVKNFLPFQMQRLTVFVQATFKILILSIYQIAA